MGILEKGSPFSLVRETVTRITELTLCDRSLPGRPELDPCPAIGVGFQDDQGGSCDFKQAITGSTIGRHDVRGPINLDLTYAYVLGIFAV